MYKRKTDKEDVKGIIPSAFLTRYTLAAVTVWILIILMSLLWNLYKEREQIRNLAIGQARASFNKDRAFRYWAASHGGVYVPIDERTPPNPNLVHLPERDLVTPSGKRLTLMNPAYILRQLMDEYADVYGIKGRMTSLKPFWPANKPDEWEQRALRAFEKGEKEVSEFSEINGEPYLRLMRPLVTEEACLKCHGVQGYRVGDIRGGVGVAVPLAPIEALHRGHFIIMYMTHIAIWALGLIGMFISVWRIRGHVEARNAAVVELRESNEVLENIFSSSAVLIAYLDRDFDFIRVNKKYAEADEREPEYFIGKNHFDLYPNEENKLIFQDVLRSGRPFSASAKAFVYAEKPERGITYWDWDLSPVKNEHGDVEALILSLVDVTEQMRAVHALRESEEKYLALFESDLVGVSIVGRHGSFMKVNTAFQQMLGYTEQELLSRKVADISHPEELDENLQLFNEVLEGKRTNYRMEKKYIRKDGSIVWGDLSVFAISDESGNFKYCFAMVKDITERKMAQEQLESSLEEKDTLLKEIHHRVKNNMQIVSSLLSLQRRYTAERAAIRALEEGQSRIKAMALIHEKLYQSRDFRRIDVADYIVTLVSRILYSFGRRNIRLRPTIDVEQIGFDVLIPCGLIINELVTNALKHAFPPGEPGELAIEFRKISDDKMLLSITDDGRGLPEGVQIESPTTLGLLIVDTLVQQLEGHIEVDTSRGTKFLITFPYKTEYGKKETAL